MITPLSRSLDPLPGESLYGFLLRLSCRLEVTPELLSRRTGLIEDLPGNAWARTVLGLSLPPRTAMDFATATRLSVEEVSRLTLEPIAAHFPPVRDSLASPRSQWDWLFPTTRRYCPHCLAGDGTQIQQQYGGPWNVLWRLPDVFACPSHHSFLEHACPSCQLPLGTKDYSRLIPRSTTVGLHPAQCRAPTLAPSTRTSPAAGCQARLDRPCPPTARNAPPPEYLALQQRILDKLSPDHPAHESARYFTDLHLTGALVIATWPLGAPPGEDLTTRAATTVLAERRRLESVRTNPSNIPPADSRACAAVLLAADTILSAPDLPRALSLLAAPTGHGTKKPQLYETWDALFRKSRQTCSPAFQLAVDKALTVGRRGPGRRTRPRPGTTFRPEHVPAFLRDEWVDRHLSAFPGIPIWQLRRGGAVILAKRALGGSMIDAAHYLGILTRTSTRFNGILANRLRERGLSRAFDSALDAIEHEELNHHHTDYEQRRRLLSNWAIPLQTWQTEILCPELSRGTTGDRKRLASSAYVWAQVTHGEPILAPVPVEIRNDDIRQSVWREDLVNVCSYIKQTQHRPHYIVLKKQLDAYARRLEGALDRQRSTRQPKHSPAN
jgi:hypothetical protein